MDETILKLSMVFILLISFFYSRFFLRNFCKQEVENFKIFCKKRGINFRRTVLIIFIFSYSFLILLFEKFLFLFFVVILLPPFFNEKYSFFVIIFYFSIFFLSNYFLFFIIFNLFTLIYFSFK